MEIDYTSYLNTIIQLLGTCTALLAISVGLTIARIVIGAAKSRDLL